jgi:DNA-binding NarL/FixJ family response regulator
MSATGPSIRILIADAQPIFRAGLRRGLEAEPDLGVVGEAGDGDEAVRLVQSLKPDLLLLDPEMSRTDGLEALRRLSGLEPRVSTILLTASLNHDQLVEAVRLGVHGVVSKDASRDLLLKAVRSVLAGQYWLGREEVADVVRSLLVTTPELNGPDVGVAALPLTPREREVVTAVVQGFSNREIAVRLSVSEDTVKHHLTNIYDKLGLSSRVELVVHALSRGLAAEA